MQPGVTISGRVTDAQGRGLARVCVFAASQQQSGEVGLAFTGSRGRYSIRNLAPGQYQLDFGCGGGRYADQWYANEPDAATAKVLDLSAGTTSGINAVLQPAGSITGKVTSKSGRPLKGICVSATNTRDLSSAAAIFIGGSFGQATNAEGVYKVSGLAAGSYDIEFTDCQSARPLYSQQWYRHTAS